LRGEPFLDACSPVENATAKPGDRWALPQLSPAIERPLANFQIGGGFILFKEIG